MCESRKSISRITASFFIILLCFCPSSFSLNNITQLSQPNLATIQKKLGTAQRPIRVGVSVDAPFTYFEDGKLDGLAGVLFLKIAKFYHWHYTLIPLKENIEFAVQQLRENKIDLLIGPISVYHHRIVHIDYTRPYYINEVGIALKKVNVSPVRVFLQILDQIGPITVLSFLCITLILSTVLWYFEHREKKSQLPMPFFKGVLTAMWFFLVQFLQGGYTLSHKHLAARITFIVWLTFSFILLTLFISSVTAFLTTDLINAHPHIISKSDLRGHVLGYVKGRGAVIYIKQLKAKPAAYENLQDALEALNKKNSKITGVVEDYMVLKTRHEAMDMPKVIISNLTLANDEFAFALPYHSPLTVPINQMIVKLQDNQDMYYLCERYLKDKAKNCQL